MVTKVQRKVPLCLWISACSSKSQEAQKSNFMWPPTATQVDSENQLHPSLSARIYFCFGLQKLSQKLMDTPIPRMARAIDTIHVWEGWADVLNPHFKHEETIIWRGWIFPSILFPWAQPIFTEMQQFPIWQVPPVSRGRERLHSVCPPAAHGEPGAGLSFLCGAQMPGFNLHRQNPNMGRSHRRWECDPFTVLHFCPQLSQKKAS